MSNYSLKSISQNRNTIYGLSIIWIAFFHSSFTFSGILQIPLFVIKVLGNIGVDIFLMMSGISLYFSFFTDSNILNYYRKRIYRVAIPSLLVSSPYFLYKDIILNKGISSFFLDLSGISLFTNGTRTIWFITSILILYFLYPFLFIILKKTKWSPFTLLEMISFSLLINMVIRYYFPAFWENTEIFFRRIPSFIFGSYLGKYVYEDKKISVPKYQIMVTTGLFVLCFEFVLHKLQNTSAPFIRYSYIPLSFAIICFFSVVGDMRVAKKTVDKLAPYTLEIYLTHEKFLELFNSVLENSNRFMVNVLAFLSSLIAALVLKKVEKLIIGWISRTKKAQNQMIKTI